MNKQLKWLKANGKFLNAEAIADEVGMPARTLRAVLRSERKLPDKHSKKLLTWIEKFRK